MRVSAWFRAASIFANRKPSPSVRGFGPRPPSHHLRVTPAGSYTLAGRRLALLLPSLFAPPTKRRADSHDHKNEHNILHGRTTSIRPELPRDLRRSNPTAPSRPPLVPGTISARAVCSRSWQPHSFSPPDSKSSGTTARPVFLRIFGRVSDPSLSDGRIDVGVRGALDPPCRSSGPEGRGCTCQASCCSSRAQPARRRS